MDNFTDIAQDVHTVAEHDLDQAFTLLELSKHLLTEAEHDELMDELIALEIEEQPMMFLKTRNGIKTFVDTDGLV